MDPALRRAVMRSVAGSSAAEDESEYGRTARTSTPHQARARPRTASKASKPMQAPAKRKRTRSAKGDLAVQEGVTAARDRLKSFLRKASTYDMSIGEERVFGETEPYKYDVIVTRDSSREKKGVVEIVVFEYDPEGDDEGAQYIRVIAPWKQRERASSDFLWKVSEKLTGDDDDGDDDDNDD